jgi:hypothetical protein
MARKKNKKSKNKAKPLRVIQPDSAGIDIGLNISERPLLLIIQSAVKIIKLCF